MWLGILNWYVVVIGIGMGISNTESKDFLSLTFLVSNNPSPKTTLVAAIILLTSHFHKSTLPSAMPRFSRWSKLPIPIHHHSNPGDRHRRFRVQDKTWFFFKTLIACLKFSSFFYQSIYWFISLFFSISSGLFAFSLLLWLLQKPTCRPIFPLTLLHQPTHGWVWKFFNHISHPFTTNVNAGSGVWFGWFVDYRSLSLLEIQ